MNTYQLFGDLDDVFAIQKKTVRIDTVYTMQGVDVILLAEAAKIRTIRHQGVIGFSLRVALLFEIDRMGKTWTCQLRFHKTAHADQAEKYPPHATANVTKKISRVNYD
ncbi:unnamed protein product, partial [Mesorhabditis spiculigera]